MSDKPIAVVTGASGFLATHVIKKLVERGTYQIRGTVRNLSDPSKVESLKTLFPSLVLYEAELTKEGSFDEVVKGATVVFHTASPFPLGEVSDPVKELVEPAVNGTKTVLESCAKAGTVKRVIVTSSVAAIAGKRPPGHVYTDDDWNLDSTATFESYRYSKRMAEEVAWNFVKEKKGTFDVAVINPSFILGPPLNKREDATSIKKVKKFFKGESDGTCFGCVDVRDVAEAHVKAAELSNAGGNRYLVGSEEAIPNIQLSRYLVESGEFTGYPLPTENNFPPPTIIKYSHAKAEKELGIKFTPIQKTMVDMAHALIDLGIVEKK